MAVEKPAESASALQTLKSNIEALAEKALRPYIQRLNPTSVPRATKEFSDPVWSTIYLTAFEIVIVDCPLFQRLRRIRQLGVVHWIYPGATHTRFEHSLGCLFQVQELITAINRQIESSSPQEKGISPDQRCVLRLTALCHDLGHNVMSHVFENAFRSTVTFSTLSNDFVEQHPNTEGVQLSEIFAYYIIGSPAFGELVTLGQKLTDERHLPPDAIAQAQKAIVGEVMFDDVPLLQELISGPFDADKLDYMQRDATMAGIPRVTDVARLVRKVRAMRLAADELPSAIARVVKKEPPSYLIFGIAPSGARTLDELLLARLLLFDKVYRHQKVRAVEGMITLMLKRLQELYAGADYMLGQEFTDDSLLRADTLVRQRQEFDLKQDGAEQVVKEIQDLCDRLRERRLFVRAFAFASPLPSDPYRGRPEHILGMERFVRDISSHRRLEVLKSLENELHAIIKLLGVESATYSHLVDQSFAAHIFLDPPGSSTHAEKIPRAYLLAEDRRIRPFRESAPQMPSWPDAYLFAKDIGYIFCVPELKPYVFLAAEKVLREQYDVRTPSVVFDYIKNREQIEQLRSLLNKKGFYDRSSADLQPIPDRLNKADVPKIVRNSLLTLQGYSGPVAAEKIEQNTENFLTDQHVFDWLQQFQSDEMIEYAITMLPSLFLVGRRQMVKAAQDFKEANKEFADCVIAPLGDIKDSGPTAAYFARDLGDDVQVCSLLQALETEAPILLVDDFIGSGGQGTTIIEQLLGLELSHDLKEAPRLGLNAGSQERLKKRDIAIVYAAGLSTGERHLKEVCEKHGLKAKVHIAMRDDALPSILRPGLLGKDGDKFIKRCRDIGRELLLNPSIGHDEAWLKKKSDTGLSYGDAGLLITFPHNTPAHTLTCIWAKGTVGGKPWEPLLPRRPKK